MSDAINLTNVTYPMRLPRRVPRITGDTRRRKRRLRVKEVRGTPFQQWHKAMVRELAAQVEREVRGE